MKNVSDRIERAKNILDYDVDPLGGNDSLAGFQDALADLASGGDLVIRAGTYLISDDLTIPSNIRLVFDSDGKIKIADTKTLTLNKEPEAGLYQIFECVGLSSMVVFGMDSIKKVYPQWWGATGDGVTDDTEALQNWADAVGNGGLLILPTPAVAYLISDTIWFGRWSINGGEVQGMRNIKIGITVRGESFGFTPDSGDPRVKWVGDDQPGTSTEDIATSLTGSITAYADYGGGYVQATSTAHGLLTQHRVTITETTNYNGTYTITKVDDNNFRFQHSWDGDDATGTWTGVYRLVTDGKAMFHFVGGRNNEVSNIHLDGDNKAYVGIWYEGNHTLITFRHMCIQQCYYNVKLGIKYSIELGGSVYYGYAGDPTWTAGRNAMAAGGYQADYHFYQNCWFKSPKVSNFSSESEQAVSTTFMSCSFSGGNNADYGVVVAGGRLHFKSSIFNGDYATAAVRCYTGTNRLSFSDLHAEDSAAYFFYGQSGIEAHVSFYNCNVLGSSRTAIVYSEAGKITVVGGTYIKEFLRKSHSTSYRFILTAIGATFLEGAINVQTATTKGLCFLTAINCVLGASIITGTGAADVIQYIVGCAPLSYTSSHLFLKRHGEDYKVEWEDPQMKTEAGGVSTTWGGTKTVEHNTATALFSIQCITNQSVFVTALVRGATGAGTQRCSVYDEISFIVQKDSGDNVTISTPVTRDLGKASDVLDVTSRVYAVVDAGSNEFECTLTQQNTLSVSLGVIYTGGEIVGIHASPILSADDWTPG